MPYAAPARGMSLIEPLTVVALVGVLAAQALPHHARWQAQAQATALQTLARSATHAMALNQAGCAVTDQQARPGTCEPVTDCADLPRLLLDGLPDGYRVLPQPLTGGASGQYAAPTPCTLLVDIRLPISADAASAASPAASAADPLSHRLGFTGIAAGWGRPQHPG